MASFIGRAGFACGVAAEPPPHRTPLYQPVSANRARHRDAVSCAASHRRSLRAVRAKGSGRQRGESYFSFIYHLPRGRRHRWSRGATIRHNKTPFTGRRRANSPHRSPHPHAAPLGIRSGRKKKRKAHLITSATSNSNRHYGARQLAIVNTDSARRCYLCDTIAERRSPGPESNKDEI